MKKKVTTNFISTLFQPIYLIKDQSQLARYLKEYIIDRGTIKTVT